MGNKTAAMLLFIALPLASVVFQSVRDTERVYHQQIEDSCTPGFPDPICSRQSTTVPVLDAEGRPVVTSGFVGWEYFRALRRPDGHDDAQGTAMGMTIHYRIIADCADRAGLIYDEWLMRDQGAIARQFGIAAKRHAADDIAAEGGPSACMKPLTAATDGAGIYQGRGNDDARGIRDAAILTLDHRIGRADAHRPP